MPISPLDPKRTARHLVYPCILGTVIVGAAALVPHLSESLVVGIVLAPVLVVLVVLERVWPRRADWRPERGVLALDLFYTFVSSQGVARITKVALVALLAAGAALLAPVERWPERWPFAVQVVLALLVADLSLYLAHRWMHTRTIGWRVHLVHHTPTRMHVFASARSHPANVVLKLTVETGVLMLAGAPSPVITVWLCWMTANGLLQHANVDLATGPLRHLLATPAVHHLHHDASAEPSNFGSTTTVWDRLFGTFRDPAAHPVGAVGIAGSAVEERYGAHLVAPFLPRARLEGEHARPDGQA